jgi:hypothetical protein
MLCYVRENAPKSNNFLIRVVETKTINRIRQLKIFFDITYIIIGKVSQKISLINHKY